MSKQKLTVVELCSGIGCQLRGLQNTDCFEPEVVATSEVDTDAIISYAAVHHGLTDEMCTGYKDYPALDEMRDFLRKLNIGYDPDKKKEYDWSKNGKKFEERIKKVWLSCKLNKNLGDVSLINKLPKSDVWFLSFPCQSISIAGKMGGVKQDSGTRSSLVWNTIRLLKSAKEDDILPKFMMLENVKNLVGKKFIEDFDRFNELVSELGYNVYWDVINAKNTGIPQHRERVFVVYIRKDIDTHQFTFPKPFDTGIRLIDVLDDTVDSKYYVNTPKAQALIDKLVDEGTLERLD